MSDYAFDNAWQQARQRLSGIEGWLDPGTTRILSERGVGPGWDCLEVGGGGGSIAAWLSDQVGPDGSVLATDIDTRFLDTLDRPNLRSLRHDIAREPLPTSAFDLVHTRLVIAHLPEPDTILAKLAAALRPGGWLVIEEMDFESLAIDPGCGIELAHLFATAMTAHHRVMQGRGFDPFYGRRVFGALRAQGLAGLGSEGRLSALVGGSAGATAWRLTFEQLGDQIVATGALDHDDLAAVCHLLDDPAVGFLSQATVAGWGQRPPA